VTEPGAAEGDDQVAENTCPTCAGSGTVDGSPCSTCAGTGTVDEVVGDA
jgi:DnaJ-class molecular chaperone